MTEDTSPENLRKFLESDDPAMVRMGLSMAKGTGVPEELLAYILWMYMVHDDKTIRAAAKSTFMKLAPEDAKSQVQLNWKASYRTSWELGEKLGNLEKSLNKTSISLVGFFSELLKRGDFLPIEHPDYQDEKDYLVFKKLLGNNEIRAAVAQALEIIKWKPDSEELYAIQLISMNRGYNARLLGEVAIEPLIRAIYRQWGEARENNIHHLVEIGKPAVPALIKYYKATENWEVYRLLTVELLKEELKDRNLSISGPKKALIDRLEVVTFQPDAGIDSLITSLSDNNPNIRREVVKNIGKLGNSKGIGPLIEILDDEDIDVRKNVIKSLLEIGDSSLKPITEALNHESAVVRENAIIVLGGLKNEGSVKPLTKMLQDNVLKVRQAAADNLVMIGYLGRQAVLQSYNVKNKSVRQTVAEKLGEIKLVKSANILIELLEDQSKDVRRTSLDSLIKLEKTAIGPLIKALDNQNIRRYVAKALGGIGDERAVKPLIKINLDDQEWNVQEAIKSALNKLGHKSEDGSLKELRRFLTSEDPSLRRMGLSMTKAAGCPEDILGLLLKLKLWDSNPQIKKFASDLLKNEAPASFKEKMESWKSVTRMKDVKKLGIICNQMKAMGVEDALPILPLIEKLETPSYNWRWDEVQKLSKATLVKVGEPAVQPLIGVLEKRIGENYKGVRGNNSCLGWMIAILGEIGDIRAVEVLWKIVETNEQILGWGMYGGFDKGNVYYVHRNVHGSIAKILGKNIGKDINSEERLLKILSDESKYNSPSGSKQLFGSPGRSDWRREHAVSILYVFGDLRAVELLTNMLEDEDEFVRDAAKEALKKLGHEVE